MRLLLDTHVWIWNILAPERLSRRVAQALSDDKNELWLSPVSIWELLLLAEKGKLDLDAAPERWVQEALASQPLRDAPLTREVALESRRLRLRHEDPADRFLAATARVYELTLVTADERVLACPGLATLANR